ncbi:MAG: hypothetical protein MHM6MM_000153 [Cercozoa sp. M6MM]
MCTDKCSTGDHLRPNSLVTTSDLIHPVTMKLLLSVLVVGATAQLSSFPPAEDCPEGEWENRQPCHINGSCERIDRCSSTGELVISSCAPTECPGALVCLGIELGIEDAMCLDRTEYLNEEGTNIATGPFGDDPACAALQRFGCYNLDAMEEYDGPLSDCNMGNGCPPVVLACADGSCPSETTPAPTTAEPTTAEPTTAEPTTAEPTTAEPTTAEPTTAEPTTAEPTTAEPTTAEPTTAEPTTAEPTTPEPTVTVDPSCPAGWVEVHGCYLNGDCERLERCGDMNVFRTTSCDIRECPGGLVCRASEIDGTCADRLDEPNVVAVGGDASCAILQRFECINMATMEVAPFDYCNDGEGCEQYAHACPPSVCMNGGA